MSFQDVANPPDFLTSTFNLAQYGHSSVSIVPKDESVQITTPTSPDPTRPYVTLTFAQSLDAKIAGKGGQQLALSGKESLIMTHWMRTMHDAIMVGIGTALNDNPQLNTRHLPLLDQDSSYRYHLPRPVILDSNLRLSLGCKLLKNYAEGRGRRPWVVGTVPQSDQERNAWQARRAALEAAGARVVAVEGKDGRISIPSMLSTLRNCDIRSLMVEGGATVIKSFLSSAAPSETSRPGLVDKVIVTVAPVFVGASGVGYGEDLVIHEMSQLQHIRTELFGRDAVMALTA